MIKLVLAKQILIDVNGFMEVVALEMDGCQRQLVQGIVAETRMMF